MNGTRAAALFDVDGTLVDSNYLHVQAWVTALRELGSEVDSWRVHRAIGMGSSQLLSALVGDDIAERVGEQAKDRHSELYLKSASLLRPFARARELVQAVAGLGIEVVLVTSAAPDELKRLNEEVFGCLRGQVSDRHTLR